MVIIYKAGTVISSYNTQIFSVLVSFNRMGRSSDVSRCCMEASGTRCTSKNIAMMVHLGIGLLETLSSQAKLHSTIVHS